MSKFNVKVTGLSVVDGEAGITGWRTLAHFDCRLLGLQMRGCSLVLSPQGELVPNPPGIRGPNSHRRAVHIIDRKLSEQLVKAVLPIYEALGGTWRAPAAPSATDAPTPIDRHAVTATLLAAGAPVSMRGADVAEGAPASGAGTTA